ncbi:putative serine hydrolase FSH, alpha/Beta hydrolase [Plasmopara halstedii]
MSSRLAHENVQRQTSALRHAFGTKAELLYLDAPWAASGPAPELVRSFYGKTGSFFQWWDALKRGDGIVDAVLGFSQGAAIATLLMAHYQTTYSHVPWKVCILVAGSTHALSRHKSFWMLLSGQPMTVSNSRSSFVIVRNT